MADQPEDGLPRLLGGIAVGGKSLGKAPESPLASGRDSLGGDDDSFASSDAELDEENRRVGATTHRRATLETQRRATNTTSSIVVELA